MTAATRRSPPPGAPDVGRRPPSLLLEAAADLFAERGYAGTRLDDVAAAAHVTKPIVYRHFESKKALYLALLARHERDLSGFTERGAVLHGTEPREQMLRAVLDEWLDYVRANSHAWLMLFRDSSGDEEIRARRLAVSARAREVLALFIAAMAGDAVPRARSSRPPRCSPAASPASRCGGSTTRRWRRTRCSRAR